MDNDSRKGLILKQAREAKGIALEVVHEATKIPMDALRAIEEGYTIRTLSQFYYRGFLKIYAQYLGVDIKDVVEDYQPEKLPTPIKEKKLESFAAPNISFTLTPQMKDWMIKGLAALLVFFFLVIIVKFFAQQKARRIKSGVPASRSLEKAKVIKNKEQAFSRKAGDNKTVAQKVVIAPSSAPATPSKSPSSQPEVSRKINLVVRAKKDSWLQVRVDGDVMFRSTLKKGAVEIWKAKDNIEVSGPGIADLEFELNGRILGPLAKENRRAKKVVITLDGFSVKQ